MIETWIAEVTELCDAEAYRKCYDKMPPHRKEKADKIRNQRQKAQSVGAWALYETARKESGVSEEAVFNLSHSGAYVLCSIDVSGNPQTKAGCDLEEIKALHEKIVRRGFTEAEAAYILGQSEEKERAEAFYRYWVLKESFVKATRYGMKLGFSTFEIACREGREPQLVRKPDAIKEHYFFKEYLTDKPYRIAVCSTDRLFAEQLREVSLHAYWR